MLGGILSRLGFVAIAACHGGADGLYRKQLVGKGAFGVNIILFEESDSLDARLSAMPAGGASVGSWLGCD